MDNRLASQMAFIEEIDKEKLIKRRNYISDGVTRENDAEHAWHLAIMAVLLSEYGKDEIDILKTVTMLLIHDIVEIDAGDTYAYDEEAKKTQEERERKAADRIFGILPSDQGKKLRALFDEFEEGKTAEARFARSMDTIQPTMLHAKNWGTVWSENGIKLTQILERNKYARENTEKLWEYSYENYIKPNVEAGNIINDVNN